MPGQGEPTGDKCQCVGRLAWLGPAVLPERPGNPVDTRRLALRGDGETDRTLGEAVDRTHDIGSETYLGEALSESLQGRREHGLRAIQHEADRT